MGIPILTVGARVKTAFEASGHGGERPTSGYETLFDVVEAPEIDKSVETIDVSPINAKVTQYAEGRQDPGGDKTITFNHTEDALGKWETLCALAETYEAAGRRLWFEYVYPNSNRSYFWCGKPKSFGNSGISGNSASQLNGHVVFKEDHGWDSHSQQISTTDTTKSVVKGSTATTTVSNAVGTVKVTSSNPAVATGAVATTTLTITGVDVGTAVLTLQDANEDECKIVVTCTAGA